MMATVQVVRGLTPTEARASVTDSGGFEIASSAYGSSQNPPVPSVSQFALYCRLHHVHVLAATGTVGGLTDAGSAA
jgi:hypothetical protein